MAVTLERIREAREHISPYVAKTPMLRLKNLDAYLGCEVYVKAECMQNAGSFKLRGSGYKKDLLCKGNLYKICSYLIEAISDGSSSEGDEEVSLRLVANVERALDLIHYAYPKPLTVEDAAEATGYGKSNFCKIFKSIVGKSFHRVLNEHRVKKAAEMLLETDMQISHIASEVGFSEAKTFCRVFKSVTGKTPGEYRKTANL